jgi:hypothetical protein
VDANRGWIDDAAGRLLRLREGADGWGYRPGDAPFVEPTALAALALRCVADEAAPKGGEAVMGAARWVTRMQRPDGSVGLSDGLETPNWPTAHAILLWSTVDGFESQRTRAAGWLERFRGKTFRKSPESPLGHDTSIVGWPWVEGTHPWVEPTAMAIIALARVGLGRSARVAEGARLLSDRALPSGGWNYGNNVLFRTVLRPQPGPTGLALLALASLGGREKAVGPALDYLESALPGIRSAQSLCWGTLGLSAWGRRPPDAAGWLRDGYDELSADGIVDAFGLAHLILAGCDRALNVIGLTVSSEATP